MWQLLFLVAAVSTAPTGKWIYKEEMPNDAKVCTCLAGDGEGTCKKNTGCKLAGGNKAKSCPGAIKIADKAKEEDEEYTSVSSTVCNTAWAIKTCKASSQRQDHECANGFMGIPAKGWTTDNNGTAWLSFDLPQASSVSSVFIRSGNGKSGRIDMFKIELKQAADFFVPDGSVGNIEMIDGEARGQDPLVVSFKRTTGVTSLKLTVLAPTDVVVSEFRAQDSVPSIDFDRKQSKEKIAFSRDRVNGNSPVGSIPDMPEMFIISFRLNRYTCYDKCKVITFLEADEVPTIGTMGGMMGGMMGGVDYRRLGEQKTQRLAAQPRELAFNRKPKISLRRDASDRETKLVVEMALNGAEKNTVFVSNPIKGGAVDVQVRQVFDRFNQVYRFEVVMNNLLVFSTVNTKVNFGWKKVNVLSSDRLTSDITDLKVLFGDEETNCIFPFTYEEMGGASITVENCVDDYKTVGNYVNRPACGMLPTSNQATEMSYCLPKTGEVMFNAVEIPYLTCVKDGGEIYGATQQFMKCRDTLSDDDCRNILVISSSFYGASSKKYFKCTSAPPTRKEKYGNELHSIVEIARVGSWGEWGHWNAWVNKKQLRTRQKMCTFEPCDYTFVETMTNENFIIRGDTTQCTIDDKLKEWEETFITSLAGVLNNKNNDLTWSKIADAMQKNKDAYFKEAEKCMGARGASYDVDFVCSLPGKSAIPICEVANKYAMFVTNTVLDDAKKHAPIVKPDIDHAARLKAQITKDQFTTLRLSMDGIKKKIDENDQAFRADLGGYLEQVATFDYQLAKQDKIFLTRMVKQWTKEIVIWTDKITGVLKVATGLAIAKTAAKVAQKVLELAEVIGMSFNPFAWLSGSASVTDILKATSNLGNAIKGMTKMIRLMVKLVTLSKVADNIQKGMQRNAKLHNDFKELSTMNVETAKSEDVQELALRFTRAVGSYVPGLSEKDIAKMVSDFKTILTGTCAELGTADSAPGVAMAMVAAVAGYCGKVAPLIDQLNAIYTAAYKAQFDMMDAAAKMARGLISASSAKKVTNNWKKEVTPKSFIESIIYTYIYRKDMITSACDAMEYERFGEVLPLCTALRKDPLANKIQSLSTLVVKTTHPPCDTSDRYARIPAKFDATVPGEIDLSALYRDGTVVFEIPSADYARKNKWILKSNTGEKVFLKKFEIFLPPNEATNEREDEVSVGHSGINRMNNRLFMLASSLMTTAYTYNPASTCSSVDNDPYTSPNCQSPFVSKTCITKNGMTNDKYLPSLYGKWVITLYNNGNNPGALKRHAMPKVSKNDTIYLQARVRTCSPATERTKDQSDIVPVRKRRSTSCCANEGKFWNQASDIRNDCKECPVNSLPALNGYYCKSVRCFNKATCCTEEKRCGPGEGTCKTDDECEGDLKCGKKTCAFNGNCCYGSVGSSVGSGTSISGGSSSVYPMGNGKFMITLKEVVIYTRSGKGWTKQRLAPASTGTGTIEQKLEKLGGF